MARKIKAVEINVGVVVNFNPMKLKSDPSVIRTANSFDPTARLFVCYSKREGRSSWAPFTSRPRPKEGTGYPRLFIEPAWRVAGSIQWRGDSSYLLDGANTFHGPDTAFASSSEEMTKLDNLGWIVETGVLAIRDEITSQFGRREKPPGAAGAETVDETGNPVFHGDPQ